MERETIQIQLKLNKKRISYMIELCEIIVQDLKALSILNISFRRKGYAHGIYN